PTLCARLQKTPGVEPAARLCSVRAQPDSCVFQIIHFFDYLYRAADIPHLVSFPSPPEQSEASLELSALFFVRSPPVRSNTTRRDVYDRQIRLLEDLRRAVQSAILFAL